MNVMNPQPHPTENLGARPLVVSRDEWLKARRALLEKEKAFTRARDALNSERRSLPMVEVTKDYRFETPEGRRSLRDLFEGRRQLIVYHFMFSPDDPPPGETHPWSEGCPGCSHIADNMPHLAHLHARDTSFTMVSRAQLAKIEPFKRRMGWTLPWVSSFGSDFNYDFHVTLDPAVAPPDYNYQPVQPSQLDGKEYSISGEQPGLSCFLQDRGRIYHTYSAFSRGLDILLNTYNLLDMTALGRQEAWEDSPAGWPQSDDFWLRHHDRYDGQPKAAPNCCQD